MSENSSAAAPTPPPHVSYAEIARVFLRMSLVSFGGPVAHIAMGESELVTRRGWISRAAYLDMIAASNLIPGPNSTEVMIHVGYHLRGIAGAVLAGVCFIAPSFCITLVVAMLYVATGALPQVGAVLWGIKPVMVALIAQVTVRLFPSVLQNRVLIGLFVAAIAVSAPPHIARWLGQTEWPGYPSEVVMMLVIGALYALWQTRDRWWRKPTDGAPLAIVWPALGPLLAQGGTLTVLGGAGAVAVGLWELFWYFLRVGSVLFGSGYLLVSYLQQDLAHSYGWLTTQQVLDAVAIGQTTPGPVLTTAAVVGYLLAGVGGAVVSTVAIFLPAFVLVIVTAPLLPKVRAAVFWRAFLDGVNVGVLAAILLTLLDLGNVALRTPTAERVSVLALVLFGAALVALLRTKINVTVLIVIGGVVGGVAGALGWMG
jgi:chromate transporter